MLVQILYTTFGITAEMIFNIFFVLEDYRDAVKEGDIERIAQMHKDFLFYFKTGRLFNVYAIEMMVNIAQNDVLF